MLLSGVPIPGCRSPLPLGPTFAFQIGLGLANRRRREGHWQPTSVTALGGILVGDGRVAAGVSELGPAMSDGESGFPANYSRSGPTIIRDYSRRPRRGRAHAPDYGAAEPGLRSHWPRIKVGSGNLNRGRRQLKVLNRGQRGLHADIAHQSLMVGPLTVGVPHVCASRRTAERLVVVCLELLGAQSAVVPQ